MEKNTYPRKLHSYKVYNHLTGEVFESYAISRNRARRKALDFAKDFARADGILNGVKFIFNRYECHIIKKTEDPATINRYQTNLLSSIKRARLYAER